MPRFTSPLVPLYYYILHFPYTFRSTAMNNLERARTPCFPIPFFFVLPFFVHISVFISIHPVRRLFGLFPITTVFHVRMACTKASFTISRLRCNFVCKSMELCTHTLCVNGIAFTVTSYTFLASPVATMQQQSHSYDAI